MDDYESETEYWLDCIECEFPTPGMSREEMRQAIKNDEMDAEGC